MPSSRRRTTDTRIIDRIDRYTTNKSENLNARMATWGNRCWDLVSEGPRRRRKLLVSRLPRVSLSATRDSWKWTSSSRDCIFSPFSISLPCHLDTPGTSKSKFYPPCIFNRVKWIQTNSVSRIVVGNISWNNGLITLCAVIELHMYNGLFVNLSSNQSQK